MTKKGKVMLTVFSVLSIAASIILCNIFYGTVSPKEIVTEKISRFLNTHFDENTYEYATYDGRIPQNYIDCKKDVCNYEGEVIIYVKYYCTDNVPFEYNVWYDKIETDKFEPYYDDEDAYSPPKKDEIKNFANWCANAFDSDENRTGIDYDFDEIYQKKTVTIIGLKITEIHKFCTILTAKVIYFTLQMKHFHKKQDITYVMSCF